MSPRSQCDVPSKMLYGDLKTMAAALLTETGEVSPGVRVARVAIADNSNLALVRVLNLKEQPVKLLEGQPIGGLKPVQVTDEEENMQSPEVSIDDLVLERLLEDLPDDVPLEAKGRLKALRGVQASVLS